MTDKTKPTTEPKKKNHSPQLLAAGAAIELAKLDASDVKAKETLARNESSRKAVMSSLGPDATEFLRRLLGTAAKG